MSQTKPVEIRGAPFGSEKIGPRTIMATIQAADEPMVHTYIEYSPASGGTHVQRLFSATPHLARRVAAMLLRCADAADPTGNRSGRHRSPHAQRARDLRRAIAHNDLRGRGVPPRSFTNTMASSAAAAPVEGS